jgi:hypothetical protein
LIFGNGFLEKVLKISIFFMEGESAVRILVESFGIFFFMVFGMVRSLYDRFEVWILCE